jgi:hypothetical protein
VSVEVSSRRWWYWFVGQYERMGVAREKSLGEEYDAARCGKFVIRQEIPDGSSCGACIPSASGRLHRRSSKLVVGQEPVLFCEERKRLSSCH